LYEDEDDALDSLAQSLAGVRFIFFLFCCGVIFVEVFAGELRFLVALGLAAWSLINWLPLAAGKSLFLGGYEFLSSFVDQLVTIFSAQGNGFQEVVGPVVDIWDC
jgi:hypothetical protein